MDIFSIVKEVESSRVMGRMLKRRSVFIFLKRICHPQCHIKNWLLKHLTERQFIPYILNSADDKKNLENSTNVNVILLNFKNRFAVIIEAKVLSDISYGDYT